LALMPAGQVEAMVERICHDIDTAIEEVKARHRFDIVINEGYLPVRAGQNPAKGPLFDDYPSDHSAGLIPYREDERPPQHPGLQKRREQMLGWHFGQWKESQELVSGTSIDRLVVSGGEEVTHEALAVMLELHPMREDLRRDLVEFARARRARGTR